MEVVEVATYPASPSRYKKRIACLVLFKVCSRSLQEGVPSVIRLDAVQGSRAALRL